MMSFLVLTPLLLAVVLLASVLMLSLQSDAGSKHICRVELLRGQRDAATELKKLTELNPEAARLRRLRSRAERVLARAPGATKVAPAIYLAKIVYDQLQLRARQQKHIVLLKAHPDLASQRVVSTLRTKQVAAHIRKMTRPSVQGLPVFSLTPHYSPAPGFSEDQRNEVEWNISIASLLPESWRRNSWIRTLSQDLQIKGNCGATLETAGVGFNAIGGSKWQEVLSWVRRS
jgi:hypothetical protein